MKPGAPPLQSARLLDQVRERIRYLHYSLKAEKACLYRVRFFVRWSATQPGGMRHPRDMSAHDDEAFLSMMANERRVSASTHNRALSAILFLYWEVLNIDLPWLNPVGRPQQAKRIPAVLTRKEGRGKRSVSLLAPMEGTPAVLVRLLSVSPADSSGRTQAATGCAASRDTWAAVCLTVASQLPFNDVQ